MRIVYLAAGAGGSYCGACAHDVTLARGLTAAGHDVMVTPVYSPLTTDMPDPSVPRVFLGGVNCYLEQRFGWYRCVPRLLTRLLDRPALLRSVSRFAVETQPERLGPMTVSVLQGLNGRQRREMEQLIAFLACGPQPDVAHLTNSLLSGLAPAIKSRLNAAVVCSLQGEEDFVERLGPPHRDRAVALLRRNAAAVDLFLAPTEGYAEEMAALLDVPRDRIETTPPGVDLAPFESIQVEPDGRFRIGFLSRLSPVKGLDILVEAFRMMEARRLGGQVLAVAGQADGGGARYWRRLRDSLDRDGLAGCVEEGGQPNLAGKVRFLKRCSVFCLPARQAGRAAAACLEALAAGLPVVAPNAGIYPDILTPTGAGVLLQRGDAADVAEVIEALRDDPVRRECMAEAARAASRLFSAEAMVRRTIEAYERVVARLSEGRS